MPVLSSARLENLALEALRNVTDVGSHARTIWRNAKISRINAARVELAESWVVRVDGVRTTLVFVVALEVGHATSDHARDLVLDCRKHH